MAMLHKENIYSHITVCNIMQAAPVPIVLNVKLFHNKFFKHDIIFKCKVWLNSNSTKYHHEMNAHLKRESGACWKKMCNLKRVNVIICYRWNSSVAITVFRVHVRNHMSANTHHRSRLFFFRFFGMWSGTFSLLFWARMYLQQKKPTPLFYTRIIAGLSNSVNWAP